MYKFIILLSLLIYNICGLEKELPACKQMSHGRDNVTPALLGKRIFYDHNHHIQERLENLAFKRLRILYDHRQAETPFCDDLITLEENEIVLRSLLKETGIYRINELFLTPSKELEVPSHLLDESVVRIASFLIELYNKGFYEDQETRINNLKYIIEMCKKSEDKVSSSSSGSPAIMKNEESKSSSSSSSNALPQKAETTTEEDTIYAAIERIVAQFEQLLKSNNPNIPNVILYNNPFKQSPYSLKAFQIPIHPPSHTTTAGVTDRSVVKAWIQAGQATMLLEELYTQYHQQANKVILKWIEAIENVGEKVEIIADYYTLTGKLCELKGQFDLEGLRYQQLEDAILQQLLRTPTPQGRDLALAQMLASSLVGNYTWHVRGKLEKIQDEMGNAIRGLSHNISHYIYVYYDRKILVADKAVDTPTESCSVTQAYEKREYLEPPSLEGDSTLEQPPCSSQNFLEIKPSLYGMVEEPQYHKPKGDENRKCIESSILGRQELSQIMESDAHLQMLSATIYYGYLIVLGYWCEGYDDIPIRRTTMIELERLWRVADSWKSGSGQGV